MSAWGQLSVGALMMRLPAYVWVTKHTLSKPNGDTKMLMRANACVRQLTHVLPSHKCITHTGTYLPSPALAMSVACVLPSSIDSQKEAATVYERPSPLLMAE